jgi:hypothetical protein
MLIKKELWHRTGCRFEERELSSVALLRVLAKVLNTGMVDNVQ